MPVPLLPHECMQMILIWLTLFAVSLNYKSQCRFTIPSKLADSKQACFKRLKTEYMLVDSRQRKATLTQGLNIPINGISLKTSRQ